MKYQTISLKQFFWCERRGLLCSHSKGDIFICEDNMLFSHVKIACYFHMWRKQVYARNLTLDFICVYTIKNDNLTNTLCFQNIDHFTCYFPFLEPEVDVQIVSVTSPTSQSILVKWQVNIRFIFTKPISMLLQRLSPSRYWGVRILSSPSPLRPPPSDALILSDPKTHKWRLCMSPISSL